MEDIRLDIKPLSVNRAWEGRRFKSGEYEVYERAVLLMLPTIKLPEPPFRIYYEFGFSNKLCDYDNPIKATQDCLQKKYGFNDNEIYEAFIRKRIVKKGQEYIRVKLEHIEIEGYGEKTSKKTSGKRKTQTAITDSRLSCKR